MPPSFFIAPRAASPPRCVKRPRHHDSHLLSAHSMRHGPSPRPNLLAPSSTASRGASSAYPRYANATSRPTARRLPALAEDQIRRHITQPPSYATRRFSLLHLRRLDPGGTHHGFGSASEPPPTFVCTSRYLLLPAPPSLCQPPHASRLNADVFPASTFICGGRCRCPRRPSALSADFAATHSSGTR